MNLVLLRFTNVLALIIFLNAATTSKGTPKVIDASGKGVSRDADSGIAFAKFKLHKFSYLNITSLGTDYVLNSSECGLACVNIPSCFSFNLAAFYVINGSISCELLPSDKYNNSDKFVPSQFFHHFSIGSPCMSSPCLNNGMCVSIYANNGYSCFCMDGITGKNCETDVDECASNPCLNNGTCTDRVNGFECSCAPGFIGTRCETDVDECASNPCLNNGTCTDGVNGFECSCAPGFIGTRCETENWLQMSPSSVCFGSKDDIYGSFAIPTSGKIITFKLKYVSGHLICDTSEASSQSRWGCFAMIGVHITDTNRNSLLPHSSYMNGGGDCVYNKYYDLPWATSNDDELRLDDFSPSLSVSNGEEFQVWLAEDLNNCSEENNSDDKTCAEVSALYE
ncbi:uncharacterized protein LOC144665726 isoform X2 [Oculina patagonica]